MELTGTTSNIFKRRNAHYDVCCDFIARNRDTLFSGVSIQDLIFLGHHTSKMDILKIVEFPSLSERIKAHMIDTTFDILAGWHKFYNAQQDPHLKALIIFGKQLTAGLGRH